MNIITEKQVQKRIHLQKAFEIIEESYEKFSNKETITPATVALQVPDGVLYSFPTYIKGSPIFISKQATDFRENAKHGLPTVHPYILVFDSVTGVLHSLIEGRYFAAVRTSLSSTVGVKHLTDNPKKLAIIGSGVQGKAHAWILPTIFSSIEEVRIYSKTPSHSSKAVIEISKQISINVIAESSAEEAIKDADIIVTATTSKTPLFLSEHVKHSALIIGVGAMKQDQEIPTEVMGKAQIIVDAESNIPMYDEIRLPKELGLKAEVLGEIGSIISGGVSVDRRKMIVFKHHGLPVTDAALAESLFIK